MTYSERRARERASAMAAKPGVIAAATDAMGEFHREVALSISLIDKVESLYARGRVSLQEDSQVLAWAAASTPTFRRLATEFGAVNANLSRLLGSISAT